MRRDELNSVGAKTWRCFHCDDVFTRENEARLHFGAHEDREPACLIKAGGEGALLKALRDAENEVEQWMMAVHNENTEAAKAYYAQQSRHRQQLEAVEVTAYEKGLRDASLDIDAIRLSRVDAVIEKAAVAGDAAVYEAMRSENFDPTIPDNVAEYVGNAVRAALSAALAAEQPVAVDEWRPIDTAPRDGTNILVWSEGYSWPEVVRHVQYDDPDLEEETGEAGYWRYSDDVFADILQIEEGEFTHWRPLPVPPTTRTADSAEAGGSATFTSGAYAALEKERRE